MNVWADLDGCQANENANETSFSIYLPNYHPLLKYVTGEIISRSKLRMYEQCHQIILTSSITKQFPVHESTRFIVSLQAIPF